MSAMDRVLETINSLDLNSHVAELETLGYTTIKGVLSDDQVERAGQAIMASVEKRTGKPVDPETGAGYEGGWRYVPHMLYDDEVFEDILMEARPLALVTYLLGESCMLSSIGCHFKGPGGDSLALHSDNANGMPAPFPSYAQIANVNYALSPYSKKEGALVMVPGSHRYVRHPRSDESQLHGEATNSKAVTMDLTPGDCVIWHGNTWHGSYAREVPGIRMNLSVYFCRQYVLPQEPHKDNVPQEVLDRHSDDERFKILLGAKQPYGWQKEGPRAGLMARSPKGLFD